MITHDPTNAAFLQYQSERKEHWNAVACRLDHWRGWGGYYHRRLAQIFRFLTVPKQRVLEIGCARGDLLTEVEPEVGVGVDLSNAMLNRAKLRHPEIAFIQADAHSLPLDQKFDCIIVSDLLNDLWDVQALFEEIKNLTHSRTRVIINLYSRLWEQPLRLAERFGLAKPNLQQNWLTVEDVSNLLNLTGFEVIRHWPEIIWPLPTPFIDQIFNQILVRLWPIRHLALTNFIMARPSPPPFEPKKDPYVSVIIPARNEAGNITEIFTRTPEMGRGTELIFVEGHSKDNTYETIERAITDHKERDCRLFKQVGEGKGDAVRTGFKHAKGDILIILDADLTVPPEDLPRFYKVLCTRKGDFANGVRLVYPIEDEAMRFLNLVGNKFFCQVFSWLIGQPIKDTLCGTKALWKNDYELIASNRSYFGDFDPFGDFDLILGAARQNLKIVDVPIRYRKRTYGSTNIQRWQHGWLLIRMVLFAAKRLKFI
jgi:2-polyprenyl-3-methyl-5-hydroxy-6-metoxy-1,4-benzoquinol methylase